MAERLLAKPAAQGCRRENNFRSRRWSRAATNALELLVSAGWPAKAIAVHCSAIDGYPRSWRAVTDKSHAIGLSSARGVGQFPAIGDRYDADIADLMLLDRSAREMARELSRQYGYPISESAVKRRLPHMPPSLLAAWSKRKEARRRRGISKSYDRRRSA